MILKNKVVEGLYKDSYQLIFPGTKIGSTIKEETFSQMEPKDKESSGDENHLICPTSLKQSL